MTYRRESLRDILDNMQRDAWRWYADDVVGLLDEFPLDCNLALKAQEGDRARCAKRVAA